MILLLRIAIRNLLLQSHRSLLLGALVAFVTLLLVVQAALLAGARESLLGTATTMLSGNLNVGGFFKIDPVQSAPVLIDSGPVERTLREGLPELASLRLRGRGQATLVGPRSSLQVQLVALDAEREPGLVAGMAVVSGSLAKLSEPGTVALFENQARKLGVQRGDAVTFSAKTQRGAYNTLDARVVAVLKENGMASFFGVLMPLESWRALFQYSASAVGSVQVSLAPGAPDARELMPRVEALVKQAGLTLVESEPGAWVYKQMQVDGQSWTGQRADVSTWYDESFLMARKLEILDALSVLLTFVLLAVIVVGLINTAWVAIHERTREIGTMRALGMRRGQVLRMFFLESLVLGTVASLVGALAGAAVCALVNAVNVPLPLAVEFWLLRTQLTFAVNGDTLFGPVVTMLVAVSLASLIPSFLAARLQPVKAMSHSG